MGMSAKTGRKLSGVQHIQQSIADILATPIGSRVMRRGYGSLLPDLIDQPLNGGTKLRAYAAIAIAIQQWEPRVRLRRVVSIASTNSPGLFSVEIEATIAVGGNGGDQRLSIIVNRGAGE